MIKRFFFILIITLMISSFTKKAFPQEKVSYMRNPFLTTKEEMKERGIKPSAKLRENIPLQKLNLSGIIYGDKKIAIINSRFYTEGDTISNFTIKEIKPLCVILKTGAKEMELKLKHVLAVSRPAVKEEKEAEKAVAGESQNTKEWTDDAIKRLLGVTE